MLDWWEKGNSLEAYGNGRLQFTVEREKHSWVLCRYRLAGEKIEFASKEFIKSKDAGKQYANNLWKSCNRS